MKISQKGLSVIKHYESFFANPYLCPAGVATIGYGTTVYDNGKKVSLRDPKITEAEACELLEYDMEKFEKAVLKLLKVTVTQDMFDALVSFAYNVGDGALAKSTLLKIINANVMKTNTDWKKQITFQFSKWSFAKVKGVSTRLKGLFSRRQTEAYLFCDGVVKFFN